MVAWLAINATLLISGVAAILRRGAVFVVLAVIARSPFVRYASIAGAMLAPVTDGWPHYWLFACVVIVAGTADILRRRRHVGARPSGSGRRFASDVG